MTCGLRKRPPESAGQVALRTAGTDMPGWQPIPPPFQWPRRNLGRRFQNLWKKTLLVVHGGHCPRYGKQKKEPLRTTKNSGFLKFCSPKSSRWHCSRLRLHEIIAGLALVWHCPSQDSHKVFWKWRKTCHTRSLCTWGLVEITWVDALLYTSWDMTPPRSTVSCPESQPHH